MAFLGEECGIVAVYIPHGHANGGRAFDYLSAGLLHLQHRGQLSAGITIYNSSVSELLRTHHGLGTIDKAFKTDEPDELRKIQHFLKGNIGIGHVRYATSGRADIKDAQPFVRNHGRKPKKFAFGFNGNLANAKDLEERLLREEQYHLERGTDTEVLAHYISHVIKNEIDDSGNVDMAQVWTQLSIQLDGAYNIVFLNANGELSWLRDPTGLKPLCYGRREDGIIAAASESIALEKMGIDNIIFVEPGEIVSIKEGMLNTERFAQAKRTECQFERVYFLRDETRLPEGTVHSIRKRLGMALAKQEFLTLNPQTDIVIPVPDTAKPAAQAYAQARGIPYIEALVRNKYAQRTFIDGGDRLEKIAQKFTVLREETEGKRVIVVDDSIVRGSTASTIIEYIRRVGKAKEVHMRVASPPVYGPCFYGIDMKTIDELFVRKFTDEQDLNPRTLRTMARRLGANTVAYLKLEQFIAALNLPRENLCLGCLTTEYPTEKGRELYKIQSQGRRERE